MSTQRLTRSSSAATFLHPMGRIKICKHEGCKNAATAAGFCRLHYLRNWKALKEEKKKKAARKLNRYVEFILKKHPDRYLDVIKKDLRSRDFEKQVDDQFGYDEEEGSENLFNEPGFEEEVLRLLGRLKIEKGF